MKEIVRIPKNKTQVTRLELKPDHLGKVAQFFPDLYKKFVLSTFINRTKTWFSYFVSAELLVLFPTIFQ